MNNVPYVRTSATSYNLHQPQCPISLVETQKSLTLQRPFHWCVWLLRFEYVCWICQPKYPHDVQQNCISSDSKISGQPRTPATIRQSIRNIITNLLKRHVRIKGPIPQLLKYIDKYWQILSNIDNILTQITISKQNTHTFVQKYESFKKQKNACGKPET